MQVENHLRRGPDPPSVSVRRPRPPSQPPRFTRVRRKQEKTVTSWTYIRSRMDYRDSPSQVMGVSAISFLLLAFCVHFSGSVCASYTRSGEHRAASSSYTKPLPRQFIPFSSPLPFLLLDFAVGPKSIQHSIGYLWHLWWGFCSALTVRKFALGTSGNKSFLNAACLEGFLFKKPPPRQLPEHAYQHSMIISS